MNHEDLNECDKCHKWLDNDNLIWITTEDFMPHDGEVLSDNAYKLYDALCEDCYHDVTKCKYCQSPAKTTLPDGTLVCAFDYSVMTELK